MKQFPHLGNRARMKHDPPAKGQAAKGQTEGLNCNALLSQHSPLVTGLDAAQDSRLIELGLKVKK